MRAAVRWCVSVFVAPLMILIASSTPALAHNRPPHHQNHAARTMVHRLETKWHCSKKEVKAALALTYQESSWNRNEVTGHYVGMWQVPRDGWIARHGRWRHVNWNTDVAMQYILKRYGSIRKALDHSYRHNWY